MILDRLTGWRRKAVLFAAGAVSVLALPPFGIVPVLLLTFPLLVRIARASATPIAAFGAGWWWGLGWYAFGISWIAEALLIEPEKFGWLIPFATLGLGGVLAVFTGLATWALWPVRAQALRSAFLLSATWALGEWLRSYVLTGFPWNPLGSVWADMLPVLQLGAYGGIHGLSMMTALSLGLLSLALERRWPWVAAAIALPLAVYGLGTARLAAHPARVVDGVLLRLVQPAIAQDGKWRDDMRERNLADQVGLSRQPGLDKVTAVIWPETAASYFLNMDTLHRRLAALAAPPGGVLITGAPRLVPPQGDEPLRLYNSLFVVSPQGDISAVYDKAHLVPFGEFVPLRKILPLTKITNGGTDFSAGPGPRTIPVPGLPAAGPLICYEAIFSGAVVGRDQPRPGWLVNLTNDGWFGMSSGPYQHLAAARMRAIEGACRWSAPPIPESRRCSTIWVVKSAVWIWVNEVSSTRFCPQHRSIPRFLVDGEMHCR